MFLSGSVSTHVFGMARAYASHVSDERASIIMKHTACLSSVWSGVSPSGGCLVALRLGGILALPCDVKVPGIRERAGGLKLNCNE